MRISDWSSDVCSSDLILLVDKLAKIDKLQSNVIGRHFGARGGTRMEYAVERWEGGPERLVLVHGSLSVGAGAFSEQESLARRFTVDVVTRRGYGETPATNGADKIGRAHV